MEIKLSDRVVDVDFNSGKGLNDLISDWSPKLRTKARSFRREGCDYDDNHSDLVIELLKFAKRYDFKRNVAFNTFAWHCINNKVAMWIQKEKAQKRSATLLKNEEFVRPISLNNNNGDEENNTLENIIYKKINYEEQTAIKIDFEEFLDKLKKDKFKYYVVIMLMKSGYKKPEIANMIGMTNQGINRIVKVLKSKNKHLNVFSDLEK